MNITNKQLKQIIKEEVQKALLEDSERFSPSPSVADVEAAGPAKRWTPPKPPTAEEIARKKAEQKARYVKWAQKWDYRGLPLNLAQRRQAEKWLKQGYQDWSGLGVGGLKIGDKLSGYQGYWEVVLTPTDKPEVGRIVVITDRGYRSKKRIDWKIKSKAEWEKWRGVKDPTLGTIKTVLWKPKPVAKTKAAAAPEAVTPTGR